MKNCSFLHAAALLLFLLLGASGCRPGAVRDRSVIILSTNDIHAHIENFPRLAAAVRACRDTAAVVLVDAGDRWTGNAYVDLAEGRKPVLTLMNRLGYDLGTLGNHEFDVGQPALQAAVDYCGFPVLCANITGSEEAALRPCESLCTLTRGGLTVGFAAVVTNYGPNGHPDGHDRIFTGLAFPDAVQTAAQLVSQLEACDVRVALTHIGRDRDFELAEAAPGYDLIIGGHSHDEVNEIRNGVLVTQTGKNLRNIGVTVLKRNGEILEHPEYTLVPLASYEPDPEYAALVEAYYADPEMQRPVGSATALANKVGLANLFTQSVRRAGKADIGIYHHGGVRLDTLAAGPVAVAKIYDLDPFGSVVSTMTMTPAQLRKLIITKFNDTVNPREAHCIDLFCTTPYTIRTDARFDAVDVRFPELVEGRRYRVAMGDYIYKNYKGLECTDGDAGEVLVTDCLLETLAAGPWEPDNRLRQAIE